MTTTPNPAAFEAIQRVLNEVMPPSWLWFSDAIAQAIASDPDVQAAMSREAKADAWEEGRSAMYDDAQQWCGRAGLTCLTGAMTNPYREAASND